MDEHPTDSRAHPIGLDEQVIELASAVLDRQHHREAEKTPGSVDGHPHSSFCDRLMQWRDRVRMGRELLAVLLPDIRRSPLERLQGLRLVCAGIPNGHDHFL